MGWGARIGKCFRQRGAGHWELSLRQGLASQWLGFQKHYCRRTRCCPVSGWSASSCWQLAELAELAELAKLAQLAQLAHLPSRCLLILQAVVVHRLVHLRRHNTHAHTLISMEINKIPILRAAPPSSLPCMSWSGGGGGDEQRAARHGTACMAAFPHSHEQPGACTRKRTTQLGMRGEQRRLPRAATHALGVSAHAPAAPRRGLACPMWRAAVKRGTAGGLRRPAAARQR